MNLQNLPWWGKLIIVAVICGIVIFSQYTMAPLDLNGKSERIESLEGDLEKLKAKILKGKQAQAKLDELQRDIASLERKLADLKQILPTEPELGDLLKWIKALADQTNLELDVFNPMAPADQQFLKEQPIRMEVVGGYHQLGRFFDRVSKYQRIINVENVTVRQARGNDEGAFAATIKANFVAKTFIYRDESQGDSGGET
jgi:type IV pilus assembly protein PilO